MYNIRESKNIYTTQKAKTARSKGYVCGRSPTEIVGSNPTGTWMSVVSVVCCQVAISVQRSVTDCGALLCVI